MIKFTKGSQKDCIAASAKLAAAGAPLFHEGDPAKIKAKASKRAVSAKRKTQRN